VATAAKKFKISPARALNILTAGRFLPQAGWNDYEAVVDALEAECLIGQQMDADYVSLFNLSRLMGTQGAKLRKEFKQRSILPVVKKIGVTMIYRRADLDP
jgi:hypothetical protein